MVEEESDARDGDVDPTIVEVPGGDASGATWDAVLARLASYGPETQRYTLKGEIARGGMGVILRCHDEGLKRPLAMKVMLGRADAPHAGDAPATGATPSVDARTLGRFLEEAQITGQLDHPNIVPVHELGVDGAGRVYFTMKLVKGQDLRHVFKLVHADEASDEGWNLIRALNVLLRVCEAMAYAHAKGVIHRDLKPGNVMVGKFGEVYVMDWGLARVLGKKDTKDLRLQHAADTTRQVSSDRRSPSSDALDSPLLTMDGDVVGTPSYMPPEQAEGRIDDIGPRADVYAAGAMLYHLLTGRMPYVNSGAHPSPHTILAAVTQGPPRPIHELRPDVPAELIAICDKAMARDIGDRYPTMLAFAEDLRAYLEQRVVAAYETGAFAELKKWVQRNRALAATAALALAATLALASWALVERQTARANETLAEERAASLLQLADVKRLADLRAEQATLWPALPQRVAAMEDWLGRARDLLARLPVHEQTLSRLRASGALDTESAWWRDTLAVLVEDLRALAADDPFGTTVRSVGIRLAFARTIRQRSIDDERAAWQRCGAEVAADPRFAGFRLVPQLGLVPLGADPASGLQEFWHVQTGARPRRGADGRIEVSENMGIVLVLIPGGLTEIGAQSRDPAGPRFDPDAGSDEAGADGLPVRVALAPYLIGKYELTQWQWGHITGGIPSLYGPHNWGELWGASRVHADLAHPVEQVSWDDCMSMLARIGLTLPTEAQWEAACRAGTDTPWWTGRDPAELDTAANLADAYAEKNGGGGWEAWDGALDDGYSVHARVGSYRPNAFGLHDTIGNVFEWCRDSYGGYDLPVNPRDGERIGGLESYRANRGGSFYHLPASARSALRFRSAPTLRVNSLGCRAARVVDVE